MDADREDVRVPETREEYIELLVTHLGFEPDEAEVLVNEGFLAGLRYHHAVAGLA